MPPASLPPQLFQRPPSSAPPRPTRHVTPRGVAPWFSPAPAPPTSADTRAPFRPPLPSGSRPPFRRPLPPSSAPPPRRSAPPQGNWLEISASAADAQPIDLGLDDLADENVSSVADANVEEEDDLALPPAELEGGDEEWGKPWPHTTAAPVGVASECTWMQGRGRRASTGACGVMEDFGSGGLCSYRQYGIVPWAEQSGGVGAGMGPMSVGAGVGASMGPGVAGGGVDRRQYYGGWEVQPVTMPATTWRAPERRDDEADVGGKADGKGGGASAVEQEDVENSARALLTRRFSAKMLSNGMRESSWYGFDVSDESDEETVVADAMPEEQALKEFNSAARINVAEYDRYPEGSSVFGRKSSGMGSGMGSGTSGSRSAMGTGSSLSSERRSSVAEEKEKAKKKSGGMRGAFAGAFRCWGGA